VSQSLAPELLRGLRLYGHRPIASVMPAKPTTAEPCADQRNRGPTREAALSARQDEQQAEVMTATRPSRGNCPPQVWRCPFLNGLRDLLASSSALIKGEHLASEVSG